MPEKTLYFQSPRHLAELFVGNEANLLLLDQLLGVSCVTRDDWVRIDGPEEAVALAESFFELLELGRRNGLKITRGDFRHTLEAVHRGEVEELREAFGEQMRIVLKKTSIVPKTINQKRYLQAIRQRDIVFGIGPAGTGKTYLAVASALEALLGGTVERIILTRPAVEAGEALGFLPGDLNEKVQPYLQPLFDAINEMMGPIDGARLMGDPREHRAGRIEIAPLAYMRGRTLSNAFIILDEAQNTTPEQMMMALTRLGHGSRLVITGDKTQIDLPRHKYSGLKEAEKVLAKVEGIAFHYLDGRDVVRNPLVQKIIEAYSSYEKQTGAHRPREVSAD
jgi:phosphate starvation-inducible protein PhoH and related proteins